METFINHYSIKPSECLNEYTQVLQKEIILLKEKEAEGDVIISCGGKFFRVHGVILAICSDFLRSLLEMTVSEQPFIVLTGVKPGCIELILKYMYDGFVYLSREDVDDFMRVGDMLKIKIFDREENLVKEFKENENKNKKSSKRRKDGKEGSKKVVLKKKARPKRKCHNAEFKTMLHKSLLGRPTKNGDEKWNIWHEVKNRKMDGSPIKAKKKNKIEEGKEGRGKIKCDNLSHKRTNEINKEEEDLEKPAKAVFAWKLRMIKAKKKMKSRRVRCRTCKACRRKDCQSCCNCRNMIKYGGAGRSKQACIMRKCLTPLHNSSMKSLPHLLTKDICNEELRETVSGGEASSDVSVRSSKEEANENFEERLTNVSKSTKELQIKVEEATEIENDKIDTNLIILKSDDYESEETFSNLEKCLQNGELDSTTVENMRPIGANCENSPSNSRLNFPIIEKLCKNGELTMEDSYQSDSKYENNPNNSRLNFPIIKYMCKSNYFNFDTMEDACQNGAKYEDSCKNNQLRFVTVKDLCPNDENCVDSCERNDANKDLCEIKCRNFDELCENDKNGEDLPLNESMGFCENVEDSNIFDVNEKWVNTMDRCKISEKFCDKLSFPRIKIVKCGNIKEYNKKKLNRPKNLTKSAKNIRSRNNGKKAKKSKKQEINPKSKMTKTNFKKSEKLLENVIPEDSVNLLDLQGSDELNFIDLNAPTNDQ